MSALRAIYENGNLRLLDPVDLKEGQRVDIVLQVKTEDDVLHEALADMNVQWPDPNAVMEEVDEDGLLDEIYTATRGTPPLSDAIIEERRESP